MTLNSPTQLPKLGREEGTLHVLNPTMRDFSMNYLDDDNQPQSITIPALETHEFDAPIARMVINHLANFVLDVKGFGYKTDVNLELKRIKEEITIG